MANYISSFARHDVRLYLEPTGRSKKVARDNAFPPFFGFPRILPRAWPGPVHTPLLYPPCWLKAIDFQTISIYSLFGELCLPPSTAQVRYLQIDASEKL